MIALFCHVRPSGSDPQGCRVGSKAFLSTRTRPDPRAGRVKALIRTRTRPIGQPNRSTFAVVGLPMLSSQKMRGIKKQPATFPTTLASIDVSFGANTLTRIQTSFTPFMQSPKSQKDAFTHAYTSHTPRFNSRHSKKNHECVSRHSDFIAVKGRHCVISTFG